jgi:hypothetical protein
MRWDERLRWRTGKEHIQAHRMGIDSAERVPGVLIFIVNLDVYHAGKLLHRLRQRLSNTVGAAIGLAIAHQINIEHAVGELDPSIANKAVPYGYESLVLLLCVRPSEVLI